MDNTKAYLNDRMNVGKEYLNDRMNVGKEYLSSSVMPKMHNISLVVSVVTLLLLISLLVGGTFADSSGLVYFAVVVTVLLNLVEVGLSVFGMRQA